MRATDESARFCVVFEHRQSFEEDLMRVAIVYDSRTGTTKAAAEMMAEVAISKGHDCSVVPVQGAERSPIERCS